MDGFIDGGSSPHTRGALPAGNAEFPQRRIIPAYAGSTPAPGAPSAPYTDHPRIRGEHMASPTSKNSNVGSSPHTRGAHRKRLTFSRAFRIIPAYAGSTRCRRRPRGRSRDHPRIRGEHALRRFVDKGTQGSSPHTRGAPRPSLPRLQVLGIIPAYAGSTLGNPCNTKDRRRDYTSFPLPVTHPSGGGGS